jgi:hypothetical protein
MPNLGIAFVREPGSESPRQYARRVHRLAAIYLVLFVACTIGTVLLLWHGRLWVSLAQHSNVETLTFAFLLVFFLYLGVLSSPGLIGALRVAYYDLLLARLGTPEIEIERRKHAALGPPRVDPPVAALNLVVERADRPCESFEIELGDDAGAMGRLEIDGAGLIHHPEVREGSNNLLAFVSHQINQILQARQQRANLDIVAWQTIDDEHAQQYLSTVHFARRLERHLGAEELWPKVRLTEDDLRELKRRLREVCPAVRSEGFLPDWEYEAEHKLPLVPEPLGLVSLSRSERRADPIASMGCALLVVLGAVGVLALLIVFPPWVPGL